MPRVREYPVELLDLPRSFYSSLRDRAELRRRLAGIDEVGEQREVFRVPGEEWDLVHVRRRGDDEIDGTAARLAAASNEGCCKSTPFTRDGGVDGERIEGGLDDPEPLRPARPLIVGAGDQHAEVQLRERRSADSALQLAWAFGRDQDRRVKEDTHLREGIDELPGKAGQVVLERLRRRRLPDAL